ncbi:MAG: FecR domain-containing protein, partial [Odoribacter sp.]|nr:FecR domain-containing protein [Odoribacter sp.]
MTIEEIIEKWLSRQELSDTEEALLDKWMLKPENREIFFELQRIRSAIYANKMSAEINPGKSWEQFNKRIRRPKMNLRFLPYTAAAAAIILSFGFLFWQSTDQYKIQSNFIPVSQQTVPNQKQVILTLSTGQKINLSDSLIPMTEKNGTTIHNTGNQLVYNTTDTASVLVYNTITVPRGGEYKLALSDGSIVWLNSESELTYPVNFGRDKREITLTGEAFFEVQQDTTRPFIVRTNQFDIRVTGTQFNVRNYAQETASATLAEGSIQLERNNRITPLCPGQQASWVEGKVQVKEIDIEEAIAWRYGAFCFKQRRLESLLDEIARWYDIEILY